MTDSLLDRRLLVITGKGGVGKTTLAAAIGIAAAERGRRTTIVEVGEQGRVASLFGAPGPAREGRATPLQRGLQSITIDPDQALLEWLQELGGRVSGRLLASSGTFQYFAAAAPGARELVSMMSIARLAAGSQREGRAAELVILDAPATGHALGMLASPRTFGAIARVGPIAKQTARVQELLADPARSAYLAVTLPTEMAVTEALELQQGLRRELDRDLAAVIVNGLLPRRFTPAEMDSIEPLEEASRNGAFTGDAEAGALVRAAAHAARAAHERGRFQHNQLARLRRRSFAVLSVPFVWSAEVDLAEVRRIAARLDARL